MEQEYRNIYRRARKAAGLTQERWAADLRAFVAARPIQPERKEKTAPAGRICRYVPGQKVV